MNLDRFALLMIAASFYLGGVLPWHPAWSRNSTGLTRRGLQPRLVSSECLLPRLDKAYNPSSP